MIHNTGGGLTKVMKFIQRRKIVKDNLLPVPPVFELIQQVAQTSDAEMHQVFNMGQRLEIYLPENQSNKVIDLIQSFNIDCQLIGFVEEAESNQLILRREQKEWQYLPGSY